MTITISSNEPSTIDRILKTLQPLRREKLVFDIKTDDDTVPPTKVEFLDDFRASLLWAKQHNAGEIENEQSFDDFLNELENELKPQKTPA